MNEQRRRAKPLPLSPLPAPPRDAQRAYCPECGEVQRSYGNWRHLYGERVTPHWREVVDPAATRSNGFMEAVTSVKCPGGIIDPVKDRAP